MISSCAFCQVVWNYWMSWPSYISSSVNTEQILWHYSCLACFGQKAQDYQLSHYYGNQLFSADTIKYSFSLSKYEKTNLKSRILLQNCSYIQYCLNGPIWPSAAKVQVQFESLKHLKWITSQVVWNYWISWVEFIIDNCIRSVKVTKGYLIIYECDIWYQIIQI
jgi:hypothetical protein